MKANNIRRGGSLLVLSFLFSFGSAAASPAPPFEGVVDTNGQFHRLTDYKGDYLVLEWLNHDCPFVRKHYETGNMQRLQRQYRDRDVTWLSVVSSAPGKQGHFPPGELDRLTETKGAHPTAVLLDPSGDMGRAYGARTTPQMFVIDPAGELIYQGAIDGRPTSRHEDVEGAHNYVDASLNQALSGQSVEVARTQPYGCSVKY